jgi:hypothetical protein
MCKRTQFPTETSPSHDHAHASLSCPSQSQSRNQPFATSGVTTPVATARSPISRSLVVSIYSDHRSIPMPILVLALTQLINRHGISPDLSLLTCQGRLPFKLPMVLRTVGSKWTQRKNELIQPNKCQEDVHFF